MKYHKKNTRKRNVYGFSLAARSGIEGGPLLENPVK